MQFAKMLEMLFIAIALHSLELGSFTGPVSDVNRYSKTCVIRHVEILCRNRQGVGLHGGKQNRKWSNRSENQRRTIE